MQKHDGNFFWKFFENIFTGQSMAGQQLKEWLISKNNFFILPPKKKKYRHDEFSFLSHFSSLLMDFILIIWLRTAFLYASRVVNWIIYCQSRVTFNYTFSLFFRALCLIHIFFACASSSLLLSINIIKHFHHPHVLMNNKQ